MKLGTLLKTAGAVAILWSAAATAQTELTVHYAQPELWRVIHENVAAKFEEEHPGVKVVFPAPSPNYNDGIQLILRGAITNSNPDVSYQGLNHLRVIAARELAVPLTDFVADEKDWEARGYHQALMDSGNRQRCRVRDGVRRFNAVDLLQRRSCPPGWRFDQQSAHNMGGNHRPWTPDQRARR